MSSDFQGGLQLATAAAAVLVTSGKEKLCLPQAFGPEIEPVMDLALPLLEDFNQHLPSPLYAVGLYVQWVQASFLKQRSEHVCWLIPVLLPRLFPEYFTFLSMTQPGSGTSGLDHLIIQIHHWQELQCQTPQKLIPPSVSFQSPEDPGTHIIFGEIGQAP